LPLTTSSDPHPYAVTLQWHGRIGVGFFLHTRFLRTDFAGVFCHALYPEIAHNKLGDEDRELVISTQQLCECLDAAEAMEAGWNHSPSIQFLPG